MTIEATPIRFGITSRWTESPTDSNVDDATKGDFVSRGMGPFKPNERQTLTFYYELPTEILGDSEALFAWAGVAIQAGIDSAGPE